MPNIVQVEITPDQMLEIALMAYNTAVELRGKNLPVILVTSRDAPEDQRDKRDDRGPDQSDRAQLSATLHIALGCGCRMHV